MPENCKKNDTSRTFSIRSFFDSIVNDSCLSYFTSDHFHVVEKGRCFRSKQMTASNLERRIKEHGIRTVINLRGRADSGWYRAEKALLKKLDASLIDIELDAHNHPTKESLALLLLSFRASAFPILIHCEHGLDRTGLASALWSFEEMRLSTKECEKQLSFLGYGHVERLAPKMKKTLKLWCNLRERFTIDEALAKYAELI